MVRAVGIVVKGGWKREVSAFGRVRRQWVGGSLSMRLHAWRQSLGIRKWIGGIATMLWSGSMGVVLKVPLSCRTASFCATWRMCIKDFGRLCDQRGKL